MRLAWLTDVHFDFVTDARFEALCQEIEASQADAILLGGDISIAHDFADWLTRMSDRLTIPLWFVLGNHDYYGGTIADVRTKATQLSIQSRPTPLGWLPHLGTVALTEDTTLIGHGGWGDGRLGDFMGSTIMLNDYIKIKDLVLTDKTALRAKLMALGDEAAHSVRVSLKQALARSKHVIMLAHVPPFHGACWYEGKISDDNWLPHFSCAAVGEVVMEVMRNHIGSLTVLCGHTHSPGEYKPLENVRVITKGATYGHPVVAQVIVAK